MQKVYRYYLLFNIVMVTSIVLPGLVRAQMDDIREGHDQLIDQELDDLESLKTFPETRTSFDNEGGDFESLSTNKNVLDVLEVKNMPLRKVLDLIEEKSDLNIIGGEGTEGTITIFLKKVNVLDALRIILDTNGYAYNEEMLSTSDQRVIRVMTAEEYELIYGYAFAEGFQSKMISLKHAEGEDILNLLEQMKGPGGKVIFDKINNTFVLMNEPQIVRSMEELIKEFDVPIETKRIDVYQADILSVRKKVEEILTEGVGSVEVNEEKQQLIVRDKPVKIKEIKRLVEEMDREEKDILIEAKIIQIILSEEHYSGVDWEAIVSNFKKLTFDDYLKGKQSLKFENISLGTLNGEDFEILLEALDTVGIVNEVADANIITQNSDVAEIMVKSMDLSKTFIGQNGQEANAFNEDLKFFVRPSADEEKNFVVDIQPEFVSSILQLAERDREGRILSHRGEDEEKFDITVNDGSTIILGSIFKEVTVASVRKIPLLGDLPFLGFAFQKPGKRKIKSEIILFLTFKSYQDE